MIDRIQRFFEQALSEPDRTAETEPTLELAATALLCEVMRADYHTGTAELDALRELLASHFSLPSGEVDELMAMAREEVEGAVDHYQFVRLIREHYSYTQRCKLVRMMWSLALADGEKHHLEEHRIRQLAELLHVSHADFIRAKLAVEEGATPPGS